MVPVRPLNLSQSQYFRGIFKDGGSPNDSDLSTPRFQLADLISLWPQLPGPVRDWIVTCAKAAIPVTSPSDPAPQN